VDKAGAKERHAEHNESSCLLPLTLLAIALVIPSKMHRYTRHDGL
jgi:hypothetical protein